VCFLGEVGSALQVRFPFPPPLVRFRRKGKERTRSFHRTPRGGGGGVPQKGRKFPSPPLPRISRKRVFSRKIRLLRSPPKGRQTSPFPPQRRKPVFFFPLLSGKDSWYAQEDALAGLLIGQGSFLSKTPSSSCGKNTISPSFQGRLPPGGFPFPRRAKTLAPSRRPLRKGSNSGFFHLQKRDTLVDFPFLM